MQIQTNHSNVLKSGASSIAPASLDAIKLNTGNRVESSSRVQQSDKVQGLAQREEVRENDSDESSSKQAMAVDIQSPIPDPLASRLGAKLQYEQQTQTSEGAVAQYLTNQHAAEREAIQQMVGIDTYA
ncbi:hypothetical protein Sps_01293 [Shewanella psychrophila]|uniref:Uncharacterized protein n=1 Tax=Shewanella psychrophila TaxID=225848 RepID=A0A1S6HLR1_9GAMM|nr:hypothetical protein [Shewanella psychrophila]AQS36461.1 hypothetical protein Sps_01293 [Shewanella psychrophila]